MRPPQRRYTSDEVVQAGRWAWASSTEDDDPDFSFDGELFWHRAEGMSRPVTVMRAWPQEGWWHERDCHCELCRPRPVRETAASPG